MKSSQVLKGQSLTIEIAPRKRDDFPMFVRRVLIDEKPVKYVSLSIDVARGDVLKVNVGFFARDVRIVEVES